MTIYKSLDDNTIIELKAYIKKLEDMLDAERSMVIELQTKIRYLEEALDNA